MDTVDFEKLVAEGYDKLPEWVREKIKNVALLVEDEPSAEDRLHEGLSDVETLLGLYKGIPLSARGEFYGVGMTMPDTITIYRLPILDAAAEECLRCNLKGAEVTPQELKDAVRKVVADTIWHEFAHHFGMDEHEVRERERQKGIDT